jgi:hypothetical protein
VATGLIPAGATRNGTSSRTQASAISGVDTSANASIMAAP